MTEGFTGIEEKGRLCREKAGTRHSPDLMKMILSMKKAHGYINLPQGGGWEGADEKRRDAWMRIEKSGYGIVSQIKRVEKRYEEIRNFMCGSGYNFMIQHKKK